MDITIVRQNTIVRHPSETFDNGRIDLAEYPHVIIIDPHVIIIDPHGGNWGTVEIGDTPHDGNESLTPRWKPAGFSAFLSPSLTYCQAGPAGLSGTNQEHHLALGVWIPYGGKGGHPHDGNWDRPPRDKFRLINHLSG